MSPLRSVIIVLVASLLDCSALPAQLSKDFILATRRSGTIEFIDPTTLEATGRIHFAVPPKSVGINGASASADGSMIYVEGPISGKPNGCCSLYAIDLATLQTRLAAGVPGTTSPADLLISEAVARPAAALTAGQIKGMRLARLHLSPDGRWVFGVVSFRGPTLVIYDVAQGSVIRELTPSGLQGDWWTTGAWSDDRFYFYAGKGDGSAARIWTVSPESTELEEGVEIEPFGQIPGCSDPLAVELTAAGGNLFLYELFGWKLDRRSQCDGEIPGGAWLLEPRTGRLLRQVAPDLHFSAIIPDWTRSVLYGLATEDSNWRGPVELVRIDARDGRILQSRLLESDFWRISTAPVRLAPIGDVRALPVAGSK
jgi:hypothetical protein